MLKKRKSLLSRACQSHEKETTNPQDQAERKVATYLQETPLPETTDPLLRWKVNQDRSQHLAQIARKILSIPATSTPKTTFSVAGVVTSGRHAALSAENVNSILFLNKNTAFSKDPSEPTESEAKLPEPVLPDLSI